MRKIDLLQMIINPFAYIVCGWWSRYKFNWFYQ